MNTFLTKMPCARSGGGAKIEALEPTPTQFEILGTIFYADRLGGGKIFVEGFLCQLEDGEVWCVPRITI